MFDVIGSYFNPILLWFGPVFMVGRNRATVCTAVVMARSGVKLTDISPVLILPFVGFIVASIGGSELGYAGFAGFLMLVTLPGCIFIIIISLINLKKQGATPLQRPSYFIILAPLSVYGIGAFNIWPSEIYMVFWSISLIAGLCFIPFIGWFRAGGWSPAWGSFTFPLSAFATVMLAGVQSDLGLMVEIIATISLGIASLIVPYVVFKNYRFWAVGQGNRMRFRL